MSNKSVIMSLSVKPGMQDVLKTAAKKKGCSVSELMRALVENYLPRMINDGDAPVSVVLVQEPAEAPKVATTEHYRQYQNMLVNLHALIAQGKGDLQEAIDLREAMEVPERHLSEEDIIVLNSLSADLEVFRKKQEEAKAHCPDAGDTKTVVLRIPNALRTDPGALRAWLDGKSAAIVQAIKR